MGGNINIDWFTERDEKKGGIWGDVWWLDFELETRSPVRGEACSRTGFAWDGGMMGRVESKNKCGCEGWQMDMKRGGCKIITCGLGWLRSTYTWNYTSCESIHTHIKKNILFFLQIKTNIHGFAFSPISLHGIFVRGSMRFLSSGWSQRPVSQPFDFV